MARGKLTRGRWALTPCSADTALRDINGLLALGVLGVLGVLGELEGGGRNAAYTWRFSAA